MAKENLYLIRVRGNGEDFYKIGVTVHKYCRFYQIMKVYKDVEIIHMIMGLDFYVAYEYESLLHGIFEPYEPNLYFGGYRECFVNVNIDTYKRVVSRIINEDNNIIENLVISWR